MVTLSGRAICTLPRQPTPIWAHHRQAVINLLRDLHRPQIVLKSSDSVWLCIVGHRSQLRRSRRQDRQKREFGFCSDARFAPGYLNVKGIVAQIQQHAFCQPFHSKNSSHIDAAQRSLFALACLYPRRQRTLPGGHRKSGPPSGGQITGANRHPLWTLCQTLIVPGAMSQLTIGVFSYNHELYVQNCVESILSGTRLPQRIIFTDDCSQDGTRSVIRGYQTMLADRGVSTHLQFGACNLGFPARLNDFLAMVDTEWFLIMSADDELVPEGVSRLLDAAEMNANVDVIFGRLQWISPEGSGIRMNHRGERMRQAVVGNYLEPRHAWTDLMRFGNFVPGGGTLLRRKPRGGWLPTYSTALTNAEDYDWYLRISRQSLFLYVDAVTLRYRILSNSKLHSAGTRLFVSQMKILSDQAVDARACERGLVELFWARAWVSALIHNRSLPPSGIRSNVAGSDSNFWRSVRAISKLLLQEGQVLVAALWRKHK